MHESRGAGTASARFVRRPLRRIEVLGLLIFTLMAVVMLAVGAALFYDWLAGPGSVPAGAPIELGPISGGLAVAGAIPLMPLVIGVDLIGGLSLIVLYMLSGVRGDA